MSQFRTFVAPNTFVWWWWLSESTIITSIPRWRRWLWLPSGIDPLFVGLACGFWFLCGILVYLTFCEKYCPCGCWHLGVTNVGGMGLLIFWTLFCLGTSYSFERVDIVVFGIGNMVFVSTHFEYAGENNTFSSVSKTSIASLCICYWHDTLVCDLPVPVWFQLVVLW